MKYHTCLLGTCYVVKLLATSLDYYAAPMFGLFKLSCEKLGFIMLYQLYIAIVNKSLK